MAFRSEDDAIGNKENYQDLNLTNYPNFLDSRSETPNNPYRYNKNMRGFVNVGEGEALPDYVMAEYINAALDGLMALERAIGATPMVPSGTSLATIPSVIESSTVAARISRIENGLFDERYGGAGWSYIPGRPTLSSHEHTGLTGQPGKINLVNEIEGILKKNNVDLTSATGITGADLSVSKTNVTLISDALADSLSKSAGGTINGAVIFKKALRSRTGGDWRADELPILSGTSLLVDTAASAGKALVSGSNTSATQLFSLSATERTDLLFGKYICIVRLKASTMVSGYGLRFQLGNATQDILGGGLPVDSYKQFYFVFEQNETTKPAHLTFTKLATGAALSVSIDSIIIEPIHPAVLDR